MGGRRKLENFDVVFQQVTEHAIRVAERMEGKRTESALINVPCKTQGEAINLQMQLRQYWRALVGALEAGELLDYDPRFHVAQKAGTLACRSNRKHKNIVEILHRGQLVTALALANALESLRDYTEKIPLPPPDTAHATPSQTPMTQEALLDAAFPEEKKG